MNKQLPTSEVELSISCRSLCKRDVLSKSDPMCVTSIFPFGQKTWTEYHRTECLSNTHDPQFSSKIQIIYRFEEQQPLQFTVYDCDSDSNSLNDHDCIGSATCSLAQIISAGKVEMKLVDPSANNMITGYIQISAEELSSCKDEIIFKIHGRELDKKNWFGKSDPFLEIYKATENADYVLVHRTEEIKNTTKPSWREFSIPVRSLCNGDFLRPLKFMCYDWNSSGNHEIIGEFFTDLKTLLDESSNRKFRLIHPKKKTKTDTKGSGEIYIEKCVKLSVHSFMDYIMGGTQLFCTFAIDFTASNGDPRSPGSLHFSSSSQMNFYEQAILSVGTIMEDYDSDKQFPVLGFGAKLPGGSISHEFFVNMNPVSPYCERVDGVLQAYKSFLRLITAGEAALYGPTNFAPVINHVANFASSYTDGSSYFILLILTDGIITDMPQTCQAIVRASKLPMSIIIVGVGTADFSAMEQLDGDTVALTAGGEKAFRDIVQFVPFSKFSGSTLPQGELLAREVLAEIPTQLLSFMKSMSILPKPKQSTVIPG